MVATAASALDVARAALAHAELRTGVRTAPLPEPSAHAPHPLSAILDGQRLPRASVSSIAGSTSLLLALLAASQGPTDWVAFVGAPDMGMLAASDAGISLDRVALIPNPGLDPAGVIAALVDGLTYVIVGHDVTLTPSQRGRLLARARERGTGVVSVGPWEQASLRLHATGHRWSGPRRGSHYLRRCTLDVERTTRGITDRWTITLPTPGNHLTAPEPGTAAPVRAQHAALSIVS